MITLHRSVKDPSSILVARDGICLGHVEPAPIGTDWLACDYDAEGRAIVPGVLRPTRQEAVDYVVAHGKWTTPVNPAAEEI